MWPGDASEDNSAGRCGLQDQKSSATTTAQMDDDATQGRGATTVSTRGRWAKSNVQQLTGAAAWSFV
jgi:hypothetical protein